MNFWYNETTQSAPSGGFVLVNASNLTTSSYSETHRTVSNYISISGSESTNFIPDPTPTFFVWIDRDLEHSSLLSDFARCRTCSRWTFIPGHFENKVCSRCRQRTFPSGGRSLALSRKPPTLDVDCRGRLRQERAILRSVRPPKRKAELRQGNERQAKRGRRDK